jgi:4-amino-4-deoxy-L-arabinose transferase-like glycosyltransferase
VRIPETDVENCDGCVAAGAREKKTFWRGIGAPIILTAFAAVLLAIAALNTRVISSDGPRYVHVAEFYRSGNFLRALDDPYHPVLPGLMALGSLVTGDLEISGQAWSVLLGALAVIPIFMLSRRAFSFRVAVATTILYSCSPFVVRFGSQVFTTSVFLFFVSAAVWLAYEASVRNSALWALLSGLAAAFGYLTRVDGLVIFGGLLAWLVAAAAWSTQTNRRVSPLLAVAFLAPFIALAGPYIAFMSGLNGNFTVTRKFTLGQLTGGQTAETTAQDTKEEGVTSPRPAPGFTLRERALRLLLPPWEVFQDTLGAFHPVLILLMIIGIVVRRRAILDNRGAVMLAAISLLMLAAMYVVAQRFGINKRRILPVLPLLVPFAGMGAEVVATWIVKGFVRVGARLEGLIETADWAGRRMIAPATTMAVTVLVCLIMLPKTMHAEGKDKLWQREAGEGIRAAARTSPALIMPEYVRVCYYAKGRGAYLNNLNDRSYHSVIDFARHSGVEFIIASDVMDEVSPGFLKNISANDMEPAFSVKAGSGSNQTIIVYRLLDHPEAPPGR